MLFTFFFNPHRQLYQISHALAHSNKIYISEPPEFDIPAQNLTLIEGSTLSIPCKTSGYPAPTIKWLKNSEEITTNVDSDVSSEDDCGGHCDAVLIIMQDCRTWISC